jgi:hypothetical protein
VRYNTISMSISSLECDSELRVISSAIADFARLQETTSHCALTLCHTVFPLLHLPALPSVRLALLCVPYWLFLWRSQCRRVDTMCKIFQMGAHTMLVWRKIWFMSLVRDKHCFVLPLYLQFFKFGNYSLCFLGKLFTSPN